MVRMVSFPDLELLFRSNAKLAADRRGVDALHAFMRQRAAIRWGAVLRLYDRVLV